MSGKWGEEEEVDGARDVNAVVPLVGQKRGRREPFCNEHASLID